MKSWKLAALLLMTMWACEVLSIIATASLFRQVRLFRNYAEDTGGHFLDNDSRWVLMWFAVAFGAICIVCTTLTVALLTSSRRKTQKSINCVRSHAAE